MRYSGAIAIRVTYLEPWCAGTPAPAGRSTRANGEYRCFLKASGYSVTIYVGAPAVLSLAVDSREAFDDAALASISFAVDESERGKHSADWASLAAMKADGSGWLISRKADGERGQKPFFAV
jgi:hypothetical protein